jgi:hypothetical protein
MGFQSPLTENPTLRSLDETIQSVADGVEERKRSERRWRIATFVVAVVAVCISAGIPLAVRTNAA